LNQLLITTVSVSTYKKGGKNRQAQQQKDSIWQIKPLTPWRIKGSDLPVGANVAREKQTLWEIVPKEIVQYFTEK
jgi:hypothetical protein